MGAISPVKLLQEHGPADGKMLSTLKDTMLKGNPFPKLHAKAAEIKHIIQPVSAFLTEHKDKGKIEGW